MRPLDAPSSAEHRPFPSPRRRRRVFEILQSSAIALDARTVAERAGSHLTTARFHLDQLVDAGLVTRRTSNERRRGRPRLLYAVQSTRRPGTTARDQLIDVIAGALADRDDAVPIAVAAGRRWAADTAVLDRREPVAGLVGAFEGLGFGAVADARARTITLQACPFFDAARAHPTVICAVHEGLIEELLQNTRVRARLRPFVQPHTCIVEILPLTDRAAGPDDSSPHRKAQETT